MPTIRIAVLGKPAPKGSMKSFGRGRMVNALPTTKPWGDLITVEAARERDRIGWKMLTGAVSVHCIAIVPRPKTVTRPYPITRSSGDNDKLARNLMDALVNAQIMRDDSQVIDQQMLKWYPRPGHSAPGMYVIVSEYVEDYKNDAQKMGAVA